jgi:hypothetical protein
VGYSMPTFCLALTILSWDCWKKWIVAAPASQRPAHSEQSWRKQDSLVTAVCVEDGPVSSLSFPNLVHRMEKIVPVREGEHPLRVPSPFMLVVTFSVTNYLFSIRFHILPHHNFISAFQITFHEVSKVVYIP